MGARINLLQLAFAAVIFSEPAPAAEGGSTRVRLKGSVRIDAHVGRSSGKVVLSGSVADETARPTPNLRVIVSALRKLNGGGLDMPVSSALPEACSNAGLRPIALSADRLLLVTDDEGRFCVRFTLPADQYTARVEAGSSELLDGATRDVTFDSSVVTLSTLGLRFDPEPRQLLLDETTTTIDVVASPDEDAPIDVVADLSLQLWNETGELLSRATTNASGRARFVFPSLRLGLPGNGELRVVFAGSLKAAPSAKSVPLERATRVLLAAARALNGALPASAADTVTLDVLAVAACKANGCGVVPTGVVEAFSGDTMAGAAALSQGEARIVATFATAQIGETTLRLRYLPDAPWFLRASDLLLTQPIRGLSRWDKLGMTLSGLAVVAWFLLSRLPSRKRSLKRPNPAPQLPAPGVRVLNATAARSGWSGRVVDVHDGTAIAGARIVMERPGFERTAVVVETFSDAKGEFRLPDAITQPGDQLRVENPLYAPLRRALPSPGDLEVSLLLRRRQLLDKLISWARKRGGRFDARPEPTPGHVRRAAGSEPQIAAWADAVERTVYGGAIVDARAQAEVEQIGPSEGKVEN
jgi:hypothetical protein